jgi:hypothetical protein
MTAVEKATVKVLGKKFNRLFVDSLCDERKPSGELVWNCICDCGNETKVVTSKITSSHTKSCGCRNREAINERTLPEGEGATRYLFRNYQKSASRDNREFTIELDEFKKLIFSNCYYCGTEPLRETKRKNHNGKISYNGIDRVDNSVGYILNNCVPCCTTCNLAKRDMGQTEFITWANKVHNNLKPKFPFNAEIFAQKHLSL